MTDLDIVEARLERWKKNKELRRLKGQAELMSNAAQNQLRVEQLSSQGTCTMSQPKLNEGHGGEVITTRDLAHFARQHWEENEELRRLIVNEANAMKMRKVERQAPAADPLAPMSLEEWRR